jgi:4-hydroxy-3-methylbut-2-enyl diphosphate reductase IspH
LGFCVGVEELIATMRRANKTADDALDVRIL